MTLLVASSVLSKDARYTSLSEVLGRCTDASNADSVRQTGGRNDSGATAAVVADWTVLVEDVALVVTSHRLVGRALLEASDIFKAAIKELKREDNSSDQEDEEGQQNMKKLRRLRKKLEFFTSWTQHPETIRFVEEHHVKEDILAWRDDWKTLGLDEEDTTKTGLGIESLKLPESSSASPSSGQDTTRFNKPQPPLLVEVQSRKRE
mmetsp:Transcript_25540/g.47597  ORF Transcript_25540/g.47597 Transcript_25540/m.47597 type:complete len:206 (+) Transcript_25540:688-1305(+)